MGGEAMQTRARCACRLCGSQQLDLDEVLDAGVLRLATCERCGHRWTERPLLAASRPLEWADTEIVEAA
jgi:uncharacterized Zn finger protein